MRDSGNTTACIRRCLERLRAGDESARAGLLEHAQARLAHLARKMLHHYPALRRWEQTDDVAQNASLRLWKSLGAVTPESETHFFRLAALHIRRELIDLTRAHFGPQGAAARHDSLPVRDDVPTVLPAAREPADSTNDPGKLAVWTDFHRKVEELPEELRDVVDLLWYQDLGQAEAAALLGVSERTLQRRWQLARIRLHQALGGIPE